ncbi:MAG: hypothetical protein R3Y12_09015 [Clostridia bacterium]
MKNNVILENNIINTAAILCGMSCCSVISIFSTQHITPVTIYSINTIKVMKNNDDKILCFNVVFMDKLDKNIQNIAVKKFNNAGKSKVIAVKLCKNIAR